LGHHKKLCFSFCDFPGATLKKSTPKQKKSELKMQGKTRKMASHEKVVLIFTLVANEVRK